MSANVPTDIRFSFTELIERGGRSGPHRDGWGITFYEGKGYRTFKESTPCIDSAMAKLIATTPIKSVNTIAHIRQANRGGLKLENTHPFTRVLWGRHWTFSHNGQVANHKNKFPLLDTLPVGTTDSEHLFCWLLDKVSERFPKRPSKMITVYRYIAKLCNKIRRQGVFNMLLTDGSVMMAFCGTNLHYITRKAPFSEAFLVSVDERVNFIEETNPTDIVTVVATNPITKNEEWVKMNAGECILWRSGGQLLHPSAKALWMELVNY